MPPERRGKSWTDQENADLIRAGDASADWGETATRLKRTRWACKVRYNALKLRTACDAVARPNVRTNRQERGALAKQFREARPEHTTITAEFFGDPLPGRSALDKRRAGIPGQQSFVSHRAPHGITLATAPPR